MIQEFVDQFMEKKLEIQAKFEESLPDDCEDIIRAVVTAIYPEDSKYDDEVMDPRRIICIDYGDTQGVSLLIIGSCAPLPENFWYVKVAYGSGSVCDILWALSFKDKAQAVDGYMTLALHLVQGLRRLPGNWDNVIG